MRLNMDFTQAYQFKISLKGLEPAIWRRIQVPANYSFWDLHVAIQDAMGWLDYHLHVFRIVNPLTSKIEEIGIPDDSRPLEVLPGWELAISDYFSGKTNSAKYEYDFGDGWEHEVILEEILSRGVNCQYPKCIAGERACPPEDCGGIGGYQDLLEAIHYPNHENRERWVTWIGSSFDSETFDPNQVRFDDPEKRWQIAFASEE